ncbi:MAG: hypothetical protein EB058_15775, partial [Proteobacteria bacterium]|nr:hypothetical protein [Pseudomonadota bacterium]
AVALGTGAGVLGTGSLATAVAADILSNPRLPSELLIVIATSSCIHEVVEPPATVNRIKVASP